MNIELIHEVAFTANSNNVELLEESSFGNETKLKFRAKLQERDVVNNNGRTYSDEVLRTIVDQLAPKATERKLLGELDHPTPQGDDKAKLKRSSTISLQDSCVLFTKIEYDGRFIIAECETLTNDKGMNLYRLLKDKVSIGFSLRAFGSSTKLPTGVIQVNALGLKALTFDVVSNPSHSNAVIYEFITEGTDVLDAIRVLENIQESVTEVNVNLLEESDNLDSDNEVPLDVACKCKNGSCLAGTITESIDYLIDMSLTKNTLKHFNFNIN